MDLEKTDVLSAFNEMEEILLEEIRKLREQQMNILQEKYARKKRSLISGRDIADSIISDLTKLDTAVKSEKPNLEKQLCYQAEFLMKKEDEFLFRKQKFSVLNKERLREDLHMLADSFQIEQYTQDELISQVHKDSFNSAIHPDDVRFVAIQTDDSGRVVRSAKLKCPSFTFDDKTCNTVCSISERGELTNSSLPQPPPPSDTRLKNYFGAVGTTYFQTGLVYYQLQVDVDIRKQLEKRDLLFEAGLAHRGYVDIKHAVSCADEGWSFTAARCPKHDMICVEAYHNHHLSYHLQLASNQVGKWDTLRYSFLVDIPHKKWHIFDAVKPAHLYSVDNIDVSQPLIPVFGAYFPTGGDTIVKVITGRDVEISDSMKEKLAKVLNYS